MYPPSSPVLRAILDLEWEMVRGAQAALEEEEGAFRLLRWMTHSVLTEDLLVRLLEHLTQARAAGRNVMTEISARMAGQRPPRNDSPRIGRIAAIEQAWMHAVHRRYPLTFPGMGDQFLIHLTAELETFPEDYLEALHGFTAASQAAGRNLVEERYQQLFEHLGHGSILDREQRAFLDSQRCGRRCQH
jgi:hypothetical protein